MLSADPALRSGAVLLAHGSSEPGTESELEALRAGLAASVPGWRFAHAFLNQEPKLEAAVAELARAGCARVRILPLLVFTGRHVLQDIPRELRRLRVLHPRIEFDLEPHLFRLPGFAGLLADSLNQPASGGSARA